MVRATVDQARGAARRTNGGRATCLGTATPVWPPAVCANLTRSGWTSGGAGRSGSATPAKVSPRDPSRTVVDPRRPPPAIP